VPTSSMSLQSRGETEPLRPTRSSIHSPPRATHLVLSRRGEPGHCRGTDWKAIQDQVSPLHGGGLRPYPDWTLNTLCPTTVGLAARGRAGRDGELGRAKAPETLGGSPGPQGIQ
jgi:hypothetical protein